MYCPRSLKKTNLLIIAPEYPDSAENNIGGIFVKRQIEELKKMITGDIYVIIPVPILGKLYELYKHSKIQRSYSNNNLHVIYLTTLSPVILPRIFHTFEKIRYTLPANKILSYIHKNNLNISLIHAHFSNPCGVIANILKKKLNCKSILTIHENSEWFSKEVASNNPFITSGWKNADLLIRVNPIDIPILKKYNQSSIFIGNGFSSEYQALDKRKCRMLLGIDQEKKILFGMGILTLRKGYHNLINAMLNLHKRYPNLLCIIGGMGSEYAHLQKLISKYGLSDCCKLIGYVPKDTAPIWMNAADLFVSPSVAESFGIVYIEALACGTPVIACKNDGSNSIITSNEYGLLCEPNDIHALELALDIGLNTKWNRNKIITYSKNYTWSNICKKIYSEYLKLMT